jgi:ParB family chromosome partitioning protein
MQEWYTPSQIVEAARSVLDQIDLDPASCEAANRIVKATRYYTRSDDGLTQPWWGRIWLNHPFGRKENKQWIGQLIGAFLDRDIEAACCITYTCTSEAWFQPLFAYPQCWIFPRLNYVDASGHPVRGVPKGSVVTYLGQKHYLFARVFGRFGHITIPFSVLEGQHDA